MIKVLLMLKAISGCGDGLGGHSFDNDVVVLVVIGVVDVGVITNVVSVIAYFLCLFLY